MVLFHTISTNASLVLLAKASTWSGWFLLLLCSIEIPEVNANSVDLIRRPVCQLHFWGSPDLKWANLLDSCQSFHIFFTLCGYKLIDPWKSFPSSSYDVRFHLYSTNSFSILHTGRCQSFLISSYESLVYSTAASRSQFFILCISQRNCFCKVIHSLNWITWYTVEPQWLEHLWDHDGNSFETWVVRATEG